MPLTRRSDEGSQVGRSGEARRAHDGGFAATPLRGEYVVVDDVTTTGSTMLACAAALRAGGADSVHGVALALG
jgi:predicted amidophosphoribosyltransferase